MILILIFLSIVICGLILSIYQVHSRKYSWDDFSVEDAMAMHESPTVFAKLILNLEPHSYQVDLLENRSRGIVVVWGRQLGKTFTLAILAIWFSVTRPNKRVVILAPSKKQATIMYREIQKIIKGNQWLEQICTKNIKSEIIWSNGSSITNFTIGQNNAESLKGESVDLLLWDEFELTENPEETWSNVQPCLSSTHGSVILISTPLSKKGEFYKFFLFAKGIRCSITEDFFNLPPGKGIEWSLANKELLLQLQVPFGLPSTYGLHFKRRDTGESQIDEDILWDARIKFPDLRFKQEYLAMFLDEEISYWSERDMINSQRYDYTYVESDQEGIQGLMVDWGGTHDNTAITVVKKEKIPNICEDEFAVRVLNRWLFKPSDYPNGECDHKAELGFIKNVIYHNFNLSYIFSDPGTVGYEATRQLEEWGIDKSITVKRVVFNPVGKEKYYGKAKVLMQQGRFLFQPGDQELIDHFMNVQYKFSENTRRIQFYLPGKNYFDDLCDSACGSMTIIDFVDNLTSNVEKTKKIIKSSQRYDNLDGYQPQRMETVASKIIRSRKKGRRSRRSLNSGGYW